MTAIPASSGPGLTSEASSSVEKEGEEGGREAEKEGGEVEKKAEKEGEEGREGGRKAEGEVERKAEKEEREAEGKAPMADKKELRQTQESGEMSFPDSTHNSVEIQRDKSSGDEETTAITDDDHGIAMATEGAHVMYDKKSSDLDAPKVKTAVEGVGVECHSETTEGGEVPHREPIEDEHEWEYRHTAAPTRSSDSLSMRDRRFNVYRQTWDPGEDDSDKEVTTETLEEQAKIEARELAAYR